MEHIYSYDKLLPFLSKTSTATDVSSTISPSHTMTFCVVDMNLRLRRSTNISLTASCTCRQTVVSSPLLKPLSFVSSESPGLNPWISHWMDCMQRLQEGSYRWSLGSSVERMGLFLWKCWGSGGSRNDSHLGGSLRGRRRYGGRLKRRRLSKKGSMPWRKAIESWIEYNCIYSLTI